MPELPTSNHSATRSPAETTGSRNSIRALTIVVILTTLASLLTAGTVAVSSTAQVVQGSEVDQAGRQRRLVQRVADDVSTLRLDPADERVRAELGRTARDLRAIRTGLLRGDLDRNLDGSVPSDFRRLYSSDGLHLDDRLESFEQAAITIATSSGAVDPAAAAVIADEAASGRLVSDLDVAFESLTAAQLSQTADRQRIAVIGLLTTCGLGLFALALLRRVRSRVGIQLSAGDALVAEIMDSEELYRATVNSIVDGVIIQNEVGDIVRINEAGTRILAPHVDESKLSPEAPAADVRSLMLNEAGRPLADDERLFELALETPGAIVDRIIGLPKGNGISWFSCNTVATEPRSGAGRLVVTTFADITAELRMTAELADQEQRFRLALEHAPIGMALVSINGAFLTVNNSLCELTGRRPHELIADGFLQLSHPDDAPFTQQDLHELVSSGRDVVSGVRRILAADGSTVHVHVALSIVRPDSGTAPYFIVDFLDVTETLRAAEAQQVALTREQEAVASLVALDDARKNFISTISHELRTPLTSLVGYLEMLEDAGDLTSHQLKMVGASVRNGERLGRLIEDLLQLSSAEQVTSVSRNAAVVISELLAGVVETLTPLATRGQVALAGLIDVPDAVVIGDRSELERVLINIVGNAVKFTPPHGDVTVSAAVRDTPRREIEIRVVDTGVGIPEAEQDRLFTKFFRSSNAQAHDIKGTGLGLVIAGKLVEAHGGRIQLSSVEEQGTTVTIHLPLAVSTMHPDDRAFALN